MIIIDDNNYIKNIQKIFKNIDDNNYIKKIFKHIDDNNYIENIQRDWWEYLDQKHTTKLSSLNV